MTRALGGAAHVSVDLIEVPVRAGDRYLLCSDGLTGMLPDEELYEHFRVGEHARRHRRSLIEVANTRGGVDNITAILVEVKDVDAGRSDAAKTDRKASRRTRKGRRASGESTAVSSTPLPRTALAGPDAPLRPRRGPSFCSRLPATGAPVDRRRALPAVRFPGGGPRPPTRAPRATLRTRQRRGGGPRS